MLDTFEEESRITALLMREKAQPECGKGRGTRRGCREMWRAVPEGQGHLRRHSGGNAGKNIVIFLKGPQDKARM